MADQRITLGSLRVLGRGRPTAEVGFRAGLNVIVGASDTGKTYILQAIDYLLGAKGPLRRIPESAGYESVLLDINPSSGAPFTLRRALGGGDLTLQEFGSGRAEPLTNEQRLSRVHSADPERSLSAYLLRTIGLSAREVRKNQGGQKTSLSFRDVSHLTLVDEQRIIREGSPVLSGQYTTGTREKNVFALFLTGQDDSQLIAAQALLDVSVDREAERGLLGELIAERTAALDPAARNAGELRSRAVRLERAIADRSRVILTSKEQIGQAERRRSVLVANRTRATSPADVRP